MVRSIPTRHTLGLALMGIIGCGHVEVEARATEAGPAPADAGSDPSAGDAGPARMDSDEALAVATAAPSLPRTAHLTLLASSGNGTLDTSGRDTLWHLAFDDGVASYLVTVEAGRGPRVEASNRLECPERVLEPPSSANVVPDAVHRFAPVAKGHANYFFEAITRCAPAANRAAVGMILDVEGPGGFTAEYDAAGGFVTSCGPCLSAMLECGAQCQ